jgi:ribonuclease-3
VSGSGLTEIFRTRSDIEANVVQALLASHGIETVRTAGPPPGVFAFAVNPMGETRVSVRDEDATDALRIIASHRQDVGGGLVVPLPQEFDALEARLGYRFKDRGLLEHALTHRSKAHEDPSGGVTDNESLEFLGDSVLGLVVADALFHAFPGFTEGQKSKVKADLVSTASLAELADRLGLGEHMILGRGEEKTGGRRKQALLADTCEALIAAIYLDGGLEPVRQFLRRELAAGIDEARRPDYFGRDHKSRLQERLQALGRPLPSYIVAGEAGPDHRKLFLVEVVVGDAIIARGSGRTKKEAEQDAARLAIETLESPVSPKRPLSREGGD